MKKIFILLLLTLFSFVLIAQEEKLSNYEKYRIEKENELYGNDNAKQDTIIVYDTIYVNAEYDPMVINNNYNQPNYRFGLTFGYLYSYYNQPYYGYYNSWYYNNWYYGYGNYPYHTHYYPYYNTRYYGNYFYHNRKPRGRRYASSSALGRNRNYYQPYNKTYRSGYATPPTASKKSIVVNRPVRKQTTTRSINTRTNGKRNAYVPRYNKSQTRTRAPYNNTKVTRNRRTTQTKTVQPQRQQQNNYIRRSTTPSRSYNAPSRAPSKSYSTPSRSSGSRSYNNGSTTRNSNSRSSSGSTSRSSSSNKGRR